MRVYVEMIKMKVLEILVRINERNLLFFLFLYEGVLREEEEKVWVRSIFLSRSLVIMMIEYEFLVCI